MSLARLVYYVTSIPTLLLGVKNWPTMVAIIMGLPVSNPLVELRDGCRFRVRTPMDVWVIKESCLDRQYERVSVEIADGWNILEIGAGLGDFAVSVAKAHPHRTVYAYEPFPESFALFQDNLGLNNIENVRAFPYAIGAHNGPLPLHVVPTEAGQSTTVSESNKNGPDLQVPGITLDQVFADLQLPVCDYLKMDCEGAEYDILFHTSGSTFKKIRHLCLEYHDGFTTYTHQDLARFIEENGFHVQCTPSPAHRHLGFLYAANLGSPGNS